MKTIERLKKKHENDTTPITTKSFRERSKENGEKLIACFGFVFELNNFSSHHPGGDFLNHFIGKDITPWMLITHAKSEQALKSLITKSIGKLEASKSDAHPFNLSLLPAMDAEYVQIFFDFNRREIFAVQNAWTMMDIFEVYFPLFVGYWMMLSFALTSWIFWFGFLLMGIAASRQGIFYHDIMHRSVFACAKKARNIVYYSSMLIWAFNFNVTGDIHDIHHGFVNIIGLDTAIDMPLLPCDKKQLALKKPGIPAFLREYFFAANAYFYLFLAWVILPYYSLYPFFARSLTRGEAIVHLARIALLYCFWDYQYQFVVAAAVGYFYFAAVGSLNHFHKEMTTPDVFFADHLTPGEKGTISTFVALQSQTVQNTDHGPLIDALLGHFTLHVEHHLFPLMPRRNYAVISEEIQQFLKKYNLGYSVCSQYDALSSFNHILRFPDSEK